QASLSWWKIQKLGRWSKSPRCRLRSSTYRRLQTTLQNSLLMLSSDDIGKKAKRLTAKARVWRQPKQTTSGSSTGFLNFPTLSRAAVLIAYLATLRTWVGRLSAEHLVTRFVTSFDGNT